MRDIFTYPNNQSIGYIDPQYYGDNPGFDGFSKKILDLQLGNYLPWPNLTPPQSGGFPYLGNVTTIGKYYNYYDSVNGTNNLTMNDFWKFPAVTATKKLIDSEVVISAEAGSVPLDSEIAVSGEHDFENGMLVTISGINGSWDDAGLNDNDYYVTNFTTGLGRFNLAVGAPDGPIIRFREFAQETATNITLGQPVVFTFNSLGAPFVDNQEVNITDFDGTLGDLYNGNTFYVQNATATTCTLSSFPNNTTPLNLVQEYRDKYTIVGGKSSQQAQITFVNSQPMVTGDSLTLTADMDFTSSVYLNNLSVGTKLYLQQLFLGIPTYNLYKDAGLTDPVGSTIPNSQSSGRTIEYFAGGFPIYTEGGFLNPNPSRQNVLCLDQSFQNIDLDEYEAGWCRFRYHKEVTANAVVTFYVGDTATTLNIPESGSAWSSDIFWYEVSVTSGSGVRTAALYTDSTKQYRVKGLCTNPLQQQGDQGFISMDFTFLDTWSETISTDPGALSILQVIPSTTGNLNESVANPADAGEQVLPGPLVAGLTGSIAVSTSEPYKYELDMAKIEMPGTEVYSYKDAGNVTAFGAQVDTTKYWEEGAPTATFYADTGERPGVIDITVNGSGYLQTAALSTTILESEGRYTNSKDILFELNALPDVYVPPALTPLEQQNIWDTDDEWLNPGFDTRKVWPDVVTPMSASIKLNTPSTVNKSQNGIKYTRASGFTKWTLDVEYPPMRPEQFREFHAIAQAANGQAIPFFFKLRNADNQSILWADFDKEGTTPTPIFLEPITIGDTTMLLEGFQSFEQNAFQRGEVFIDGDNDNGALHTAVNTVNANVFGEAKVRVAMPVKQNKGISQPISKNPYWAVVTLDSDDFSYSVDTAGFYYMSVSFALDGWK